jgi:flagellar protein FliO/FliZ
MTKSLQLSHAILRVATPLLGLAALICAPAAEAYSPAIKSGGESTPLSLPTSSGAGSHASSSGPSIVRTIVGLLIVIAVIWGLSWILRQVKSGKETRAAGTGLSSVATLPLASGRTLHLVRAGEDYLLLGSAEHGVMPIHRYTKQEAQDAGLLDGQDGPGAGGARVARSPRTGGRSGPGEPEFEGSLVDRLRGWTVRR